MPIDKDIRDHEVLGREYKKGWEIGFKEGLEEAGRTQQALKMLLLILEKRFGALPDQAAEKLAGRSLGDLRELVVRVLDAQSLEELLPYL
jgi:hypothetical protein